MRLIAFELFKPGIDSRPHHWDSEKIAMSDEKGGGKGRVKLEERKKIFLFLRPQLTIGYHCFFFEYMVRYTNKT